MSAVVKVNKKYEWVAPDGGWGYMIILSFIIGNATNAMFMGSFGLLFNDFMIQIGIASTGSTLLFGLNAVCFSLAGFFVSPIVNVLGIRNTALLAAFIYNAGMIGTVFVNSYVPFVICQGMLPGISIGFTYSTTCGIMNQYFVKKRMFAYSIAQFSAAAITVLVPIFVRWSLEHYGFRGTLLLIAGVTMHGVLGALLMQPAKWHLKRVEIAVPSTDIQPLIDEENRSNLEKLSDKNIIVVEQDESKQLRSPNEKKMDMQFFKQFIKSCVCIGPSFSCFVETTFMVLLPQALYFIGWDQGMVAFGLFMYSLGDMAMRVVLIFTTKWIHKFGSQETYILGLVLATFAKLGMIWSKTETAINAYLFVIGVSRTFIFVLLTEVIADNVPKENFTQAIGVYMMALGVTTVIMGPAIGVTRDLTGSYYTAFYLLASFFAIIILFWTIEIVYKRNHHKRQLQRETADELKCRSKQLSRDKCSRTIN